LLLKKSLRYWHTIRFLRPIQIYGRIWFKIYHPRPNLSPPPAQRKQLSSWAATPLREISLTGPTEFCFLNKSGILGEIGWDGAAREKLWRYNQHYFDDLNAVNNTDRRNWHIDLLETWVRENPPGIGTGWEPYPTSLRIVNWIKWSLGGNQLPEKCFESLAIQTRWLEKKLEIHLLGNHLFANAKALIFAGLFYEGIEADGWYQKGRRILDQEIGEQILSDGGHFELSPMYHSLILEDLLDLINLHHTFQQEMPDLWEQIIAKMLHWLRLMCHPNGEIAFFNDTALGVAPSFIELKNYASRLKVPFHLPDAVGMSHLSESGYLRFTGSKSMIIIDLAKVGPDYLPGHAHADTLSFELSVFGQHLLVNSGISCYGNSALRLFQRGTAAHNTVQINGENSSDVWGGFRVAQRAQPTLKLLDSTAHSLLVECSHNGYLRLFNGAEHKRRWLIDEETLSVEDCIEESYDSAVARFFFHPQVNLQIEKDQARGVASLPDGNSAAWQVIQGIARVEPSNWYPRFGVSMLNQCLVIELVNAKSHVQWSWDFS